MSSHETVLGRFVQRIDTAYPLPELGVSLFPFFADQSKWESFDENRWTQALGQFPRVSAQLDQALEILLDNDAGKISNSEVAPSRVSYLAGLTYILAIPQNLTTHVPSDELKVFWYRTLARAIGVRLIQASQPQSQDKLLFPAAIIADIGVLVLINELKQSYLDFLEDARKLEQDLAQLEIESLGFDHRILASRWLSTWSISPEIGNLVGVFHLSGSELANASSEQRPNLNTVQLSEAQLFVADQAGEWLATGLSLAGNATVRTSLRVLGWDREQIQAWLERIQRTVPLLAEALAVPIVQGINIHLPLEEAWARDSAPASKEQEPQISHGQAKPESNPISNDSLPNYFSLSTPPLYPSNNSWSNSSTNGGDFRGGNPVEVAVTTTLPTGSTDSALSNDWSLDPALIGHVQNTVEQCRSHRQSLSLILMQFDNFESFLFGSSIGRLYKMHQSLLSGLERIVQLEGGKVLELGDDKFALLFPGMDRSAANRTGQDILRIVRQWSATRVQSGQTAVSVSLGCAASDAPSRNFRPHSLIEAAQRCLETVQRSSGNAIKSIDIYY